MTAAFTVKDVLIAVLTVLYMLLLGVFYLVENIVLLLVPLKWKAKNVSGDIVLVTGGGSGLGRDLAIGFAALGCKVVVWDINKKGNEETVRLIEKANGQAFSFVCDVADRNAVYNTAKLVKDQVGEVTILLNNAGIVTGKYLLDCPDDMIKKTMDVNVLSHFWTVKAFLPDMIALGRGHIVSIASMAGLVGSQRLTDYSASKFAAVGFNEALLQELRKQGHTSINLTTVCPVIIDTGLFQGAKLPFIPTYSTKEVAQTVIKGVLTNEMLILLPPVLRIAMILRWLMPSKAALAGGEMSGTTALMDGFVGREK